MNENVPSRWKCAPAATGLKLTQNLVDLLINKMTSLPPDVLCSAGSGAGLLHVVSNLQL